MKKLFVFMTICASELKQSGIQFLENLHQKPLNLCSVQRIKTTNRVLLRTTGLVAHCAGDIIGPFS